MKNPKEKVGNPIKAKLKNLVSRGVGLVTEYRENELRDRRNVDHVLSAALNRSDVLSAVRYPVAYVDFLRACIERSVHLVTEVKGDAGAPERAANRFAMLVRRLSLGLPAIDFSVAQEIALIADRNRSLSEPNEFGNANVILAALPVSGEPRKTLGRISEAHRISKEGKQL